MKVKDTLGIVWLEKSGFHVETLGIYFYGYCYSRTPSIDVNSLESLWSSLEGDIQARFSPIPEPDTFESVEIGCIFSCDVRFNRWPSDSNWCQVIEESLRIVALSKGSVAWCGGEDCTCSPDVLDPQSSAGNVYAGYASEVGFLCNSPNLSDERKDLSDEDLSLLHKVLRST